MARPKTVMGETRTTVYIYKKDIVEKHMMKKGFKHIKKYFRDLIKDDILRTGDEEDIKKYFKKPKKADGDA